MWQANFLLMFSLPVWMLSETPTKTTTKLCMSSTQKGAHFKLDYPNQSLHCQVTLPAWKVKVMRYEGWSKSSATWSNISNTEKCTYQTGLPKSITSLPSDTSSMEGKGNAYLCMRADQKVLPLKAIFTTQNKATYSNRITQSNHFIAKWQFQHGRWR